MVFSFSHISGQPEGRTETMKQINTLRKLRKSLGIKKTGHITRMGLAEEEGFEREGLLERFREGETLDDIICPMFDCDLCGNAYLQGEGNSGDTEYLEKDYNLRLDVLKTLDCACLCNDCEDLIRDKFGDTQDEYIAEQLTA